MNDVFDIFKCWKVMVENIIDIKLKTIRCDNYTKNRSGYFKKFCGQKAL